MAGCAVHASRGFSLSTKIPESALEASAIVVTVYSTSLSKMSLAISASKPETAKRRGYLPCAGVMVQGDTCILAITMAPGGARFSSTTSIPLPLNDTYDIRWTATWDDAGPDIAKSAKQAEPDLGRWQLWIPTPYGRAQLRLSEDVAFLQSPSNLK